MVIETGRRRKWFQKMRGRNTWRKRWSWMMRRRVEGEDEEEEEEEEKEEAGRDEEAGKSFVSVSTKTDFWRK